MEYPELKRRIEELLRNKQLFQYSIKLDKATTVIDPEKFVRSHFMLMDDAIARTKKGIRVNRNLYKPVMHRLKRFLEEVEKNIQENQ